MKKIHSLKAAFLILFCTLLTLTNIPQAKADNSTEMFNQFSASIIYNDYPTFERIADIYLVNNFDPLSDIDSLALGMDVAARYGNIEALSYLINKGVSASKGNPIFFAVEKRQVETVNFLIEHNADVNKHNLKGYPEAVFPIQIAIYNSDLSIVKLLLKNGASTNASSCLRSRQPVRFSYISPLAWALDYSKTIINRDEIIKLILDSGANPNECDNESALLKAIGGDDVTAIRALTTHGADLNKVVYTGLGYRRLGSSNPLNFARSLCKLNLLPLLESLGANPAESNCSANGEACKGTACN